MVCKDKACILDLVLIVKEISHVWISWMTIVFHWWRVFFDLWRYKQLPTPEGTASLVGYLKNLDEWQNSMVYGNKQHFPTLPSYCNRFILLRFPNYLFASSWWKGDLSHKKRRYLLTGTYWTAVSLACASGHHHLVSRWESIHVAPLCHVHLLSIISSVPELRRTSVQHDSGMSLTRPTSVDRFVIRRQWVLFWMMGCKRLCLNVVPQVLWCMTSMLHSPNFQHTCLTDFGIISTVITAVFVNWRYR